GPPRRIPPRPLGAGRPATTPRRIVGRGSRENHPVTRSAPADAPAYRVPSLPTRFESPEVRHCRTCSSRMRPIVVRLPVLASSPRGIAGGAEPQPGPEESAEEPILPRNGQGQESKRKFAFAGIVADDPGPSISERITGGPTK